MAAAAAGGKDGLVGYLTKQAKNNPGPFLTLLGKVIPSSILGDIEADALSITVNFNAPKPEPLIIDNEADAEAKGRA